MSAAGPEIDAQALEALQKSFDEAPEQAPEAEVPAPQEVTPEAEAPEAPEVPETPEAAEAPVEEDSFIPRADLESLLAGVEDPAAREAVETAYKSFQSGYTRKTQALAEQRAALSGLDPEAARQAVDFVTALTTDGDFALQVHERLTKELEGAGLTLRQAQAEATKQIEDAVVDPELAALGVDLDNPLVKKLNELERRERERDARERQWQAEAEERQRVEEAMALLEKQAGDIRRADPSLNDEDMDVIMKLAASTGGNLFAAEDLFKSTRDRIMTAYVNRKASVAPQLSSPAPTEHAEEPLVISSTDEGHKLAVERLKQIIAQG